MGAAPPPPPRSDPDPVPLSEPTFHALRDLLFQHTGISLSPGKRTMVQSRLARRLRALGLRDYEAYLARLEPGGGGEWPLFINALTTNLTRFFRERHHFERLVAWLRTRPEGPSKPSIWSAGCSTGEEPYTIALCLLDAFGPQCGARILATDLDSNVLATARQGIYAQSPDLEGRWLDLGFLRDPALPSDRLRVRPELRAMITFQQQNLLTGAFPAPTSLDAIFCRNVLIYFERPTQRQLVERFRACLRPGGLLFLGHSEALVAQGSGLRSLGGTAYQRAEAPPP